MSGDDPGAAQSQPLDDSGGNRMIREIWDTLTKEGKRSLLRSVRLVR